MLLKVKKKLSILSQTFMTFCVQFKCQSATESVMETCPQGPH